MMNRIMITAAGGPAGFCLAKYLKGKAHLIGLEGSTDSPAQFFCDEVYLVPFATSPDYRDEILRIVRKTGPDMIIPTFDEDLLLFDAIRDEVECFILLSSSEALHICDDKRKTAEMFPEIAARTYTVEEARRERPYPLFIRPSVGRGSKIGFKVEDDDDLEYSLRNVEKPFIQEWLPGPEVTVDTFADLEGVLLGISPRIRSQTRGGISTKARFVKDEQIEKACRIIHERLRIIGPTNIQFMKDSSGRWKLSEINPRYAGGIGLSYQAGFDSITPLLTINPKQKTVRAEKMTPNFGITVVRYWEERVVD